MRKIYCQPYSPYGLWFLRQFLGHNGARIGGKGTMERRLGFRNLTFDFCRLVLMHTGIIYKSTLNHIDLKYTPNSKCFTIIVRWLCIISQRSRVSAVLVCILVGMVQILNAKVMDEYVSDHKVDVKLSLSISPGLPSLHDF